MSAGRRALALGAVAVLLGAAWLARDAERAAGPAVADVPAPAESALPKLVDLGSDKCVPCKMMAPILEALRTDYAGAMEVVVIDVRAHPEAAGPYGIRVIPTQVFLDADGTEIARHEGFLSREAILATWADHGVRLPPRGADATSLPAGGD